MLKLRRVTSSDTYLPFIDGLRFFTLLSVVLVHFVDFYEAHTFPVRQAGFYQTLQIDKVFGYSDNCILVFFAISGFILGMPFAKSFMLNEPYPKLGKFYLRRITRLEPPYIVLLTLLLLLNVFVIHRDTLENTLPHYLASFFYVHNIVFESHPTLNFVFWTLEIEVQFYLLAPFFAYIFKLDKVKRRALLLSLMLLFGVMNELYKPPFLSLYNFIHYFLGGFLAVDLFLLNRFEKRSLADGICLILAFLVYTGLVRSGIFLPFMIMLLIYLSPSAIIWKKILTANWITIIGGMCYSLYMLHQPVMAVFLNRFFGNGSVSDILWLDFSIKLSVVLVVVLLVSTAYYVLIERPCMKRDWYKKFLPKKAGV